MKKFWCRTAEESLDEAIQIEAIDEENAALLFGAKWDNQCDNYPILNNEYENGLEVFITEELKDQKHEDKRRRFLITGTLVPEYTATLD